MSIISSSFLPSTPFHGFTFHLMDAASVRGYMYKACVHLLQHPGVLWSVSLTAVCFWFTNVSTSLPPDSSSSDSSHLEKKIQMIIEDFILLHPNQKKLVCFLCVRPQQKYMHAFTITSAITTTFCHTQILKRIQMIIEDFNLLQPNQIKFIRFFNVKL